MGALIKLVFCATGSYVELFASFTCVHCWSSFTLNVLIESRRHVGHTSIITKTVTLV